MSGGAAPRQQRDWLRSRRRRYASTGASSALPSALLITARTHRLQTGFSSALPLTTLIPV
jgi:hypothetical protein